MTSKFEFEMGSMTPSRLRQMVYLVQYVYAVYAFCEGLAREGSLQYEDGGW